MLQNIAHRLSSSNPLKKQTAQDALLKILRQSLAPKHYNMELEYWLWIHKNDVLGDLDVLQEPHMTLMSILQCICSSYGHVVGAWMNEKRIERLVVHVACNEQQQQIKVRVEALSCLMQYLINEALASLQDMVATWKMVLQLVFRHQDALVQKQHPPLQWALVHLLSSVPNAIWTALDSSMQLTIVTMVVAAAIQQRDANHTKAIGKLLMLDALVTENLRFLWDAHAMLVQLVTTSDGDQGNKKDQVALYEAAWWSLGNLSHALLASSHQATHDEDELAELREMMQSLVEPCLSVVIQGCNEKVVCSALRVMGKSCGLLQHPPLLRYWTALLNRLQQQGKHQRPKIKWNVANVLELMGRHYHLEMAEHMPTLGSKTHHLLLSIIERSENYKERIAVLSSLQVFYEAFPNMFEPLHRLCCCLLKAYISEAGASSPFDYVDTLNAHITQLLDLLLSSPLLDRKVVTEYCRMLEKENPFNAQLIEELVMVTKESTGWLLEATK